jgi:hypothetical protein
MGGGTLVAGGSGVSAVSESFEHAKSTIGMINNNNKLNTFLLTFKFKIVGLSIVLVLKNYNENNNIHKFILPDLKIIFTDTNP